MIVRHFFTSFLEKTESVFSCCRNDHSNAYFSKRRKREK